MNSSESKSPLYQWLKFFWLIISKGSFFIKPFDYAAHINDLWSENDQASVVSIKPKKTIRSWKYYLLLIPIVGPIIGVISQFRLQKRWPTYIYHLQSKKLAFVRISKNAGTSVQAAMLKSEFPNLDFSNLSVNHINEMGKTFIEPQLKENYKCFALVRNPYDRLLSCYFDQVVGRESRFYYDDYLFRIIKKGMSFESFVKTIANIPDSLKDIHFRPQSDYLKHIEKIKLFRLEDQNSELRDFLDGYSLELTNENQNAISFNPKDYYTNELKELVSEIYHEDLKYLNYHASNYHLTNA